MLKQFSAGALALGSCLVARAHEGHGLPGHSHWHAGDSGMWLGAAAVALVLWLARRRR